jgi:hypothetical protein
MTVYAITATIATRHTDRYGNAWCGSKQVPTFYLDSRVQGITDANHAASIATDVLNLLGTIDPSDITISAVAVDPERESAELDYAARKREAEQLGREMGRNAASWCIDGNTSRETCERIVAMIDAGDPAVYDMFREPDLSAEFADSYTLSDLAHDLGVSSTDDALDDYAQAWGIAAYESFWTEVERTARYQVA